MRQNLPLSFVELIFDRLDPDRFMALFLQALTNVQRVERGSIWIRQGKNYVCTEACGEEADKVRGLAISASRKSVVGTVIEGGKMVIDEPGRAIYFKGVEKKLDTKNTLILCFPLKLRDGTVYGAVQILDTTAEGKRLNLDPDYLELLEGLVTIGGIALSASLDLAQQYEKSEEMRRMREAIRSSPLMIGRSDAFLRTWRAAEIYAANDFPVMITGESGTGKELIAREIHRLGARSNKPFLVQNCTAIPDTLLESELFGYRKGAFTGADRDRVGLFEAANGGSLFLDEIGDMPLGLQAKILRVIQSHEVKPLGSTDSHTVDVRIIAATNRNLLDGIAEGTFREDLYYRLNVLPLEVPPVRERTEDIPLLLTHFMKHYAQASGQIPKALAPEVMEILVRHGWPGNIREMENLARYLLTVTRGDTVTIKDLPPPYCHGAAAVDGTPLPSPARPPVQGSAPAAAPDTGPPSWESMERDYLLSLLDSTRWNIAEAARKAGVKRTTFASRMKRLGISKK